MEVVVSTLKVAQLLHIAACLHTNQSRSYLNHLVILMMMMMMIIIIIIIIISNHRSANCELRHELSFLLTPINFVTIIAHHSSNSQTGLNRF